MATYTRGKTSGDLPIASASDIPSTTRSWISFHFALAAGVEASLYRITNARLKGTPAASRLESKRVKFSNARPEIFSVLFPKAILAKASGRREPSFDPAPTFSERLTGRRP